MKIELTEWRNHYLTIVVVCTFISLTLPFNGYNAPLAAILLLPTLFGGFKNKLDKQDWKLVSLLVFVFFYFLLNLLLRPEPLRLLDKNIRILVFIGVFFVFCKHFINSAAINLSVLMGACTSGLFSINEKVVTGTMRVGEHINPIQFGTFSMLLALLSAVILNFYFIDYIKSKSKYSLFWVGFALVSTLLGMYASIASGSRGGWLSMPLFIYIVYKQYSDSLQITKFQKTLVFLAFFSIFLAIYKTPQLQVANRLLEAKSNVTQYFKEGLIETSVGARLEMWRIALGLGIEKPVFGWGHVGYQDEIKKMVEAKKTSTLLLEFNEPHNQFLDAFAKYGLSGLMLIVMLYFWPMLELMKRYKQKIGTQQGLNALMGGVSMLAFIDFSLTHSFINKNGGIMVFLFCLTLFWALSKQEYEQASPK